MGESNIVTFPQFHLAALEMMPVVFGRSYGTVSLTIQVATRCKWSHVAIVLPCGNQVLESKGGVGVVVTPMSEFLARYREVDFRMLPCVSLEAAYIYAHSRKGLGHDRASCWGIALGMDWNDKDADQCAELVAAATGLIAEEFLHTFTPKELWRLSHAIK